MTYTLTKYIYDRGAVIPVLKRNKYIKSTKAFKELKNKMYKKYQFADDRKIHGKFNKYIYLYSLKDDNNMAIDWIKCIGEPIK